VFFSGMPSAAAGPVVDKEMPTLMSACAGTATTAIEPAAMAAASVNLLFMLPPGLQLVATGPNTASAGLEFRTPSSDSTLLEICGQEFWLHPGVNHAQALKAGMGRRWRIQGWQAGRNNSGRPVTTMAPRADASMRKVARHMKRAWWRPSWRGRRNRAPLRQTSA